MGKKRTVLVDLSTEDQPPKKTKKAKKATQPEVLTEGEAVPESPSEGPTVESEEKVTEEKKPTKAKVVKIRSGRYKSLRQKVDPQKKYSLTEAVKIVIELANAGFDETVELNLVTKKEGFSGSVKLPHGSGKTQKIVVFNDKVEKQIQAGKIDFDLLLARPADMAKIVKYARVLGPKGLMPNPKTGTIAEDPEKAAAKLSQEVHYKTEKKAPLIHAVIGKISLGETKLLENLQAFIEAVGPKQILKASISSSMGPGIKLQLE